MWSPSSLYHFSVYFPNSTLGWVEHKARIKTAGRNISNLSHAEDSTSWQKVKKN